MLDVVLDRHLEMCGKFGFEFRIVVWFVEEGGHAASQPPQPAHAFSASAASPRASTRSITPVSRCQSRASAAS